MQGISCGTNLFLSIERETTDMLMSEGGTLCSGAGKANSRELVPHPKSGAVGTSNTVEIRLDDNTTDAEVDNMEILASLSLEEIDEVHTDKTEAKFEES